MATNDVASIGVGMDTSGVESGIKSLDVLAAQGPKVENAMAGVEAAATKTGKSLKSMGEGSGKGLDEVTKSAPKAAESVGRLAKSAEDAKSAITGINASVASLGKVSTAASQSARGMSGFNTSLQSSQKTLLDMQAQVRATSTAVAQMGAVLASSVASSQAANKAQSDAAKSAADMGVAFKAAGDQVRAYSTVSSGVSDVSEKTAKSMDTTASAARALTSALAVAGVSFGANEIISLVDGYTKFTAQLQLASKGASDYALAMESTKRIATDAQQGLGEVGTLYARIANGTAELGLSQKRLSDITETVALSLKVSGASASESSSAMLQLSQAFASGVLRGEEFNSVSEAAPRLMKALADGMGVPIGALRKMAEEGKLTAEVLSIALPKALEDVRVEAEKMQTIGGSFTVLRNSMMEFFGVTAQASGAVSGITKSVQLLAENLNLVTAAALGFGAAKLGQLLIKSGVEAVKSAADTAAYAASLNQQRVAAIATAQAETAVSAARVSGLSALQAKLTAERAAAIAEASSATTTAARTSALMAASVAELNLSRTSAQLTAATAAQTVAQTALTGAITATGTAATIASRAINAIGGPIGLITTALGLGVTAWMAWGNSSKDASDKAHGAVVSTHQDIMSSLDKQIAKLRERAGLLSIGEVGLAQDVSAESAQLASLNTQIEAIRAKGSKADAADQIVMIELQRQYENLNNKLKERAKLQKEIAEAGVKSGSFEWLAIEDDKITKQFIERMKGYSDALTSGALSADGYRDAVNRLNKERYASTDAGKAEAAALKESTKGLKSGENSYASLAEKARDYVTSLNLEASQGTKLTQSQKLQIDLNNLLANSKIKVNSAAAASIQRSINEAKSIEDMAKTMKRNVADYQRYLETQKEITDDLKKREDALNAARQAMSANEQAAQEQFDRLKLESSLIGASNAQRELALAQYDAELELKRQIAAIDAMDTVNGEADREELRRRAREISAKKLAIAEGKIFVSEWDKTSQVIGQTLQDYIMGGGKDAATYLKRLFSTLVLQPIVQTVVGGILGGGQSGSAGASSGGGGLVQSGKSLWDSFSGGLTGSIGTQIAGLGAMMGSSAATAFGSGIVAGGNLGLFGGGIGQGLSMIGSGAAGSTAAGLGTIAGAALPWVAGGLAVINLLGGLGKQVTPHAGAASEYQVGKLIGGNATTAQNLVNAGDSYIKEMQAPMDQLVLAIGSSFDALAKNYGKASGYSVGAGFTSDNNDPSAGFFHLITPDGETLDKWTISRRDQHYKDRGGMYAADTEKGFDEYLKDVAFASLRGVSDIVPKWASDMAKSVQDSLKDASGADSITAFQNLVMQIAAIETAFTSLGEVMPMFVGITDDMKSSFLNLFGSIDGLTAVTSSYYGLLYSEQERMTTAGNQINATLKEMGIFSERGGLDVFNGDAAKTQLRQAVEELMAAGNAELAGKLMAMAQSFTTVADYAAKSAEEAAKAAQEAYENARDSAFSDLEDAVNRERSYWNGIASAAQTAVSSLSSTLSLLTNNARDLYGAVDSTQQMLAAQGMVYIEQALSGVLGGASASSYTGLQDAIAAARGGINSGAYATQFERDRDTLILAGQLSQLGELTDSQLSVEERALKAANTQIEQLDKTLNYWRELIEGSKNGNLSVVDAINKLALAMGVAVPEEGGAGSGSAGGGASFGGGSGAVSGGGGAPSLDSFKYIRDTWLYGDYYAKRGTDDARLDPLADLMRTFSGSGDSFAMLSAAKAAGYSLSDVQAASTGVDGVWRGSTYAEWLQEAQRVGIHAFDVGTNRVPRDMLAVVHEDERIIPAADNRQLMRALQGGGNNGELVRAFNALQSEVALLREASERTANNTFGIRRMDENLDSVTNGGTFIRTRAMP